ncbi:Gfo/Idh/MocA family oxidoreductase [Aliifodinibius sp. S!AR15-10]|uniref:Gfo/Idh/MocA family protein n=1 Tax=Aliifodinibius sp. S!AR15-10 TaxID=2950437 RepID=UPI00285D1E2F|nr:Gfo/Idh/MocA family oxidoreductase [Aliifodinibius sp. S!AR15-10]MDR8393436.1 Gfo/Idh/MocA family oxidoreductase [Aliifodinibius sp. S!AR15-10]
MSKSDDNRINRREFLTKSAILSAGITTGISAQSYGNILGANDKVRVGIVGFSNRAKGSLIPSFLDHSGELNFEIVAVSDIWNKRRNEGAQFIKEQSGKGVAQARNNEELYEKHDLDAVIISTADFQHALHCKQAVEADCDAYVEKPFAETMEDNRTALKAVEQSDKIIQIGSQRRSGRNYHAAADFIHAGKFGDIVNVEMTWNVNQPGRWRLPELTKQIREEDTDWQRYLMNRPYEPWDPRKYLEYRLFWPYSSGIPGQWMSHQIDTVHWFSGLPHPRSVSANGGIYLWKDGRENYDTMTAVFDYGPLDDKSEGFQVVYSSRFTNSAGGVKEIYYSNGGELNLETNKVTPNGGLTEHYASAMGMEPNLLEQQSLSDAAEAATSANTGVDSMTSAHMRNWMECVRSRKEPNAGVRAGYNHSIANIMTTAALRTGEYVAFDEENQEVLAGGNVFKY